MWSHTPMASCWPNTMCNYCSINRKLFFSFYVTRQIINIGFASENIWPLHYPKYYLIMFVKSYCPPIQTSITAKSTYVHRNATENSFRLFVGVWTRVFGLGATVMYCTLWLCDTLCTYAAYPLLQKDMEGQKSQELKIKGHGASMDVLWIQGSQTIICWRSSLGLHKLNRHQQPGMSPLNEWGLIELYF